MKNIKRSLSLLLVLCLLCAASVTAYADETPDGTETGSVTVKMEYDGKAAAGGTLTAYRVGERLESDGNVSFEKTAEMAAFPGSYEDITSAALVERVAAFVAEHPIPAYATAKNQNGEAVFTGLELGLYLIVQTEASEGYAPLKPFLVPVPMREDGRDVYEITAEGKLQPEPVVPDTPVKPGTPETPGTTETPGTPDTPETPDTSETPGTPLEPTLPQTGQLNWPVPVLAALGLCLFSAGWILRYGRRKDGYEE